jgi:FKBP-type peptidyl-prolyl cis-trans isomerase FkpA
MISKKDILYIICIAFPLLFSYCSRKSDDKAGIPKDYKQKLEKINKVLVDKDAENIKQFVDRRGWEMKTSQSGLWYMIYKPGNGNMVKKNDLIELKYKTWLLDGTLVYTSDSLGVKSFRVGQGGVEPGLEEGVLLLNEGSHARFILPPHLAFGLIGDDNKIPGRTIIVYDIEVVGLKKSD